MDSFNRKWITENSLQITNEYEKGILTLRGLHYQLVSIGMTNSTRHYKRVVSAMIQARWDGLIDFDCFSDHDRSMIGTTDSELTILEDSIEEGKEQIELWMNSYYKNRWENQIYYPEVFIEKKALQGVFQTICNRNSVALGACKGYPSLTFLNQATTRFKRAKANGKRPIILYFGDYDPSGEDIPRSIKQNITDLGCPSIEVRRIALMEEQVLKWELPPAPAKDTDSRTAKWEGIGQVELDAVPPRKLQNLCQSAIDEIFDNRRHTELKEAESQEQTLYKKSLRNFIENL